MNSQADLELEIESSLMKLFKLRFLLSAVIIFEVVLLFSIHRLTNRYLAGLTFKHTTTLSAR